MNNINEDLPKNIRVWSKLAQWFGRKRYVTKLLTTDDRRLTREDRHLNAPFEHVVLR